MPTRELVDVFEGSRTTGLAPATLYKLARERRLRSFKVLNAVRFDRADLLALVAERPAACPVIPAGRPAAAAMPRGQRAPQPSAISKQ